MNPDQKDFESRISFFERTLDTMSEELHQQARTIDALHRRIERVEGRLQTKGGDGEIEPHDSPPPHY